MDYKYIEQLLERYFAGETTLQEEQILNAFFGQEQLPEQLKPYQPLFAWKDAAKADEQLGDDFDERLLKIIDDDSKQQQSPNSSEHVKARTISMSQRLMPLFRAAAIVAIILTLGNAIRFSMGGQQQGYDEINYADYKDTFDDPAVAYDRVEDALQLMSEGLSMAQTADSLIQRAANFNDSLSTK